jgi:hypothetical protein
VALSLRSTAESSLSEHFLTLHQFLFFRAATKSQTFHYSPEAMSDALEPTSRSWCFALTQIMRPVTASSPSDPFGWTSQSTATLCGPKNPMAYLAKKEKDHPRCRKVYKVVKKLPWRGRCEFYYASTCATPATGTVPASRSNFWCNH